MSTALAILLLLGIALVCWANAREAAELARRTASVLCRDAGVQLLDQTVALRRMRLVRSPRGLSVQRRYSFEFSPDGVDRQRGWVTMLGMLVEGASMPAVASVTADTPPPVPTSQP